MRARRVVTLLVAAVILTPQTAVACPTCISSGFGDRAYTWPYIGLILMPFLVAVGIVGVLAWYAGWRPRTVRERLSAWTARLRQRTAATSLPPSTHTETT